MIDTAALQNKLFEEFLALGKDLKEELWNESNKQFLELIARDIASLTKKIVETKDDAKKQRYRRSVALLQNHIAIMAFSRLNVVENEVRGLFGRLLEKTVGYMVESVVTSTIGSAAG